MDGANWIRILDVCSGLALVAVGTTWMLHARRPRLLWGAFLVAWGAQLATREFQASDAYLRPALAYLNALLMPLMAVLLAVFATKEATKHPRAMGASQSVGILAAGYMAGGIVLPLAMPGLFGFSGATPLGRQPWLYQEPMLIGVAILVLALAFITDAKDRHWRVLVALAMAWGNYANFLDTSSPGSTLVTSAGASPANALLGMASIVLVGRAFIDKATWHRKLLAIAALIVCGAGTAVPPSTTWLGIALNPAAIRLLAAALLWPDKLAASAAPFNLRTPVQGSGLAIGLAAAGSLTQILSWNLGEHWNTGLATMAFGGMASIVLLGAALAISEFFRQNDGEAAPSVEQGELA